MCQLLAEYLVMFISLLWYLVDAFVQSDLQNVTNVLTCTCPINYHPVYTDVFETGESLNTF